MTDDLNAKKPALVPFDEVYRPPGASLISSRRSGAHTRRVIVAGVAIGVSQPLIAAIPVAAGWIHVPVRGLMDATTFDGVMAPLDLRLAAVRLILGLVALPGFLALVRAKASKLSKKGPRISLLVAAAAWPALSLGEIAYRL